MGVLLAGLTLGLLAVFVPGVGLLSSLRLAKPRSLWARRFYDESKQDRARRRFEDPDSRIHRLHERFDDLVGGAPTIAAMLGMRGQ